MAPKRRRLSDKNLVEFKDAVQVREAVKEERLLVATATAMLKLKTAEELRAIIAFMDGNSGPPPAECFPRGVRYMGGSGGSTVVPAYLCKALLGQIMNLSEVEVMGICQTVPWMRRLFCYAVGVEESYEIPKRSMPLGSFSSWYMDKYQSNGKVLDGKELGKGLDVCFATGYLGHYKFLGDQEYYDRIQKFPGGEVIAMPKSVHRFKQALCGSGFVFEENWSKYASMVSNEDEDTWKLASRFMKKESCKIEDHVIEMQPIAAAEAGSSKPSSSSQTAVVEPPPSEEEEEAPPPPPPPA